jgi:SAM-dependent methyltransferase
MAGGPATTRRPYQGALQILRYNWDFYAGSTVAALLALGLAAVLTRPTWLQALLMAGAAAALFWMAASLLISHYVYDRSPLYRWQWVAGTLRHSPARWLSIHAGLDESSAALRGLFPESQGVVLDIYDPAVMTESSIARARRLSPAERPVARADFRRLPLPEAAFEAAFILFTAHELRQPQARQSFFRELRRVLEPDGHFLLVEHLRDLRNLLAFGPGAFHFYPRREWLRLASESGFEIEREFSMTPFVRVFLFALGGRRSEVA